MEEQSSEKSQGGTQSNGPVLTLCFLGTGVHREEKPSVITQFAASARAVSGEVHDPKKTDTHFVHLFEGPGSKPSFSDSKHPTPGQYTYNPVTGKKEVKDFSALSKKAHRAAGLLGGVGVQDNIDEALSVIQHLESKGKLPKTINMIGHSRGADTTVRLANELMGRYPDIKVNILAIDPVAGAGRRGHRKATVIPENVKNYTAILAEDESRHFFAPQDKKRMIVASPEKTHVNYQIYPGAHSDMLRLTDDLSKNVLVELMWDDAYKFCKDNGTKLKDGAVPPYAAKFTDKNGNVERPTDIKSKDPFSLEERFRIFYSLKLNRDKFRGEGRARGVSKEREDYFRDSDYFMNKEHRELFKHLYPKLFDYLFQKSIEGATKEKALKDAEKLKSEHPYALEGLASKGLEIKDGKIVLADEPRGIRQVEAFYVLNRLKVAHTYLSYLEYTVKSAIDQYVRKHSGVSVEVMRDIRDKVDEIVRSDKDENKKISRLRKFVSKIARDFDEMPSLGAKKIMYQLQALTNDPTTYAQSINRILRKALGTARSDVKQLGKETETDEDAKVDPVIKKLVDDTKQAVKIIIEDPKLNVYEKNIALTTLLENLKKPENLSPEQVKPFKRIYREFGDLLKYRKTTFDYADMAIKRLKAYLSSRRLYRFIAKLTGNAIVNKKLLVAKEQAARKAIKELRELKGEGKGFNKYAVNQVVTDALNNKMVKNVREKTGAKKAHFERTMNDIMLRDAPAVSAALMLQKKYEEKQKDNSQEEKDDKVPGDVKEEDDLLGDKENMEKEQETAKEQKDDKVPGDVKEEDDLLGDKENKRKEQEVTTAKSKSNYGGSKKLSALMGNGSLICSGKRSKTMLKEQKQKQNQAEESPSDDTKMSGPQH